MKTQFFHRAIVLAFSLISLCLSTFGIDTGKDYYIFHSCGLVISADGSKPTLQSFNASDAQKFRFTASGNSYFIKSTQKNSNIAKTGDWNTEFSSATGNVAKFSVENCGGDFIKLKCADNALFLGVDNTTVGCNIYSDKNGNSILHYWYLREASTDVIVTDGLEAAISLAEKTYTESKEGDNEGEFSSSSRTDLIKAIETAKTSLVESNSQQDINEATTAINTAINNYTKQRNKAFKTNVKYFVMHASNRFLSNSSNVPLIKDKDKTENQQFIFEAQQDGSYAIRNVANNRYLHTNGEYGTAFNEGSTATAAHFKIDYAPNEDIYIRIQCLSNNLFIGTDGTTDGKGVYSDKTGEDGKHYWHLIRVDAPEEKIHSHFNNGSSALRLGMNWNDETGVHINAHGGCVLYENGTYYWFGENYRTTGAVKSNGIVCYTSTDLYNWKKECMAYECPSTPLRDDMQDMNFGRTLERPKVMYCPNSGKYAMWVHWENGSGYGASRVAILYSDKITGPYTFLKTMRPRGDEQPSGSRDQTLLFDPDYNVGYHFGSAEENMTMHVTLLNDNFLDLSDHWSRIFIQKQYEAPAVIKYHGRFIAITSGCTGWNPNPAHSSISELPFSGWSDMGNPCVDANLSTSYNTQSNFVFKVPNRYDAYIYMSDRWKGGDYFNDANVGESWHIWLPIDMRAGYPIIRFYSEWDLSLFDKINRYRRVESFETGKEYLLLSKNSNRILSSKDGKFIFSSDDETNNLAFRISRGDDGYYLMTDTRTGLALDAADGKLNLADSTGSIDQQWSIVSTGDNDGYFYFYPRSGNATALTNYCATTTADGVAGLNTAAKQASCQIAFCFDSQKHNYTPITDESDGSYKKWIEEDMHYIPTSTFTPLITKENDVQDRKLSILTNKNEMEITTSEAQEVLIHDVQGKCLYRFFMKSNSTRHVTLENGIYIVNNTKILISGE